MGESPESGHRAAPRRSRALPEETKRESSQRMGRLVLWLALAVLLPAPAILQPLDQAVLDEHEQMKELLTRMFVDNHREGRDLEEDMDEEEEGEARDLDNEEEEQTNLVDEESDNEEAVEAVSSNDPQEIARFNNKGGNNKESKAREERKEEETKSMGSLAGIATLRRSGDVVVADEESHKVVTSTFTVGPLQLEVSKTYGEGKARTVRTAKA